MESQEMLTFINYLFFKLNRLTVKIFFHVIFESKKSRKLKKYILKSFR